MAARAGLLFVAMSIQLAAIREAPHRRTRARGNMFARVALLIEAAFVLGPRDRVAPGIAILLLNAFFVLLLRSYPRLSRPCAAGAGNPALAAGRRHGRQSIGRAGRRRPDRGSGAGLYLVTGSCLAVIWPGILHAWSFLTVAKEEG